MSGEVTSMSLLEQLKQLDLDRLTSECAAATRVEDETARDAVLDILSAIWSDQARYEGQFRKVIGLYRYIKVAALRHLFRRQKGAKKHQTLIPEQLETPQPDPEQQVLHMLSLQQGSKWLVQAHQTLTTRESATTKKLLDQVLQQPDVYIRTRQSGEEAGHYVFHYSRLAEDLKWPRRRVYQALARLKQALLAQESAQYGEER